MKGNAPELSVKPCQESPRFNNTKIFTSTAKPKVGEKTINTFKGARTQSRRQ